MAGVGMIEPTKSFSKHGAVLKGRTKATPGERVQVRLVN